MIDHCPTGTRGVSRSGYAGTGKSRNVLLGAPHQLPRAPPLGFYRMADADARHVLALMEEGVGAVKAQAGQVVVVGGPLHLAEQ